MLPLDHFQGDAEVVEHGHGKIVMQNRCQLPVANSCFLVACPGGRVAPFAVFLIKKAKRIARAAGRNEFSAYVVLRFLLLGSRVFWARREDGEFAGVALSS